MTKKILLISPSFFSYEIDIVKKMKDFGYDVIHYDERVSKSRLFKTLVKIHPILIYPFALIRYRKIYNTIKLEKFDRILIIKSQSIPKYFLKKIYKKYSDTSLICLYLWDSLRNIKGIKSKLKYFHKVYTFDRNDAMENQKLKFLPLFFSDMFINTSNQDSNYQYDLLFVGTVHSDRYELLEEIKQISLNKQLRAKFIYYFPSKIIFTMLKLSKIKFRNADHRDFHFQAISKNDVKELIMDSKVIVDINHPKQVGLTMRTIESIGMRRKLITTNSDILNYDFFNNNNVRILDRNKIDIDLNFIGSNYKNVNEDVYNKYSLSSWISQILEVKDEK